LGQEDAKGTYRGIRDAVLGVFASTMVRQLLDPLV
jgi:hypothetical protein